MILKPTLFQFSALLDGINTLVAFLTGGTNILTDFIFGILNIVVIPIFLLCARLLNIMHIILLEAVTITPRALRDGDIIIFGTPTNPPFSSLNSTITNYLEPLSLLLILFGIAVLMFIRIFDVVIDDIGIDIEDAQSRLMLAPLLILLWPAIANIILAISHGFTEIFLNITIKYDRSAFQHITVNLPPYNQELDFLNYIESLAGNPFEGDNNTTISMIVAVLFMINAAVGYLIGIVASLFRIFAIYLLYVMGPILIAMWAFAWRDLSEMGKRYIRYFVLLSLFPIPAALINALLPVLAFSVENALMAPLSQLPDASVGIDQTPSSPRELSSDSTSTPSSFPDGDKVGVSNPLAIIGLSGIIRAFMIILFPVLVGFAPWVFVIGINGAMKVAGAATGVVAGVATGGAALAAGAGGIGKMAKGAMDSEGSTLSNFKQDASNKAGFAKSLAGAGKEYAKNNRKEIQQGAAEVGKMTGGRVGDKVASGLEKEMAVEERVKSAGETADEVKEAAKIRQNLGGEDDAESDEAVEHLENRVYRDRLNNSTVEGIFDANEDMVDDTDMLDDDVKKKRAVDRMIEDYENKSKDELIKQYGRGTVSNMDAALNKKMKYRDILSEAKELGVDDKVIQSNLAEEYASNNMDQGALYNKLQRTVNDDGLNEKQIEEAESELSEVDDTVQNEMDIDFSKLNDDIDSTAGLMRYMEENNKLAKDDSENMIESTLNMLDDETDFTNDEWENVEWVNQLEEKFDGFDWDNIESYSKFQKELNHSLENNDINEKQLSEIAESVFNSTLFKEETSSDTERELDSIKKHSRSKIENYVRGGAGESYKRDEESPARDEERVINGLGIGDEDDLDDVDVGTAHTGSSTLEAYNVDDALEQVLGSVSDEVENQIVENMEESEIGEGISDMEIDVDNESIETVEDAIQEELFSIDTDDAGNIVEASEFSRDLYNAGYGEEYIKDKQEKAAEMIDNAVKGAELQGEQAIEEIANDINELSENTIEMALEEQGVNEARKEKFMNRFKSQNSSINVSDIDNFNTDALEYINNERIANELMEATGSVAEEIADDFGLSEDSAVRNTDMLDEREMSSWEIAEEIGSSDRSTEEAAEILNKIRNDEYGQTNKGNAETRDSDPSRGSGGV